MSITAILTGYRRPQNLQFQIYALKTQTVLPDEIWLWRNYHSDWNINLSKFNGIDKYCESNYNWKYLGRFALAMMAQTDFIAIFDDDTVPGNQWFDNCLNTYNQFPGIIGGIGNVLHSTTEYMNHTRVGWASYNDNAQEVDLVGHTWFIKKEYLKYLWMEEPATYDNAEDMHLSYTAQKYGNLKTYVPPQPKTNIEMSSSLYGYQLGVDNTTPSVIDHQHFFPQRNACLQEYVKRGWKLLCCS